jgi:GTP cyclohydrolase IV
VDVHAAPRFVRPALSRVGLEGVETVVRLGVDQPSAQPFAARIDCLVEPERGRPAAGVPRFDDVVADVVRQVVVGAPGMRAERLVREVAERVRERLQAPRAEVAIAARFPERRPAPVSGTPTQEISTLHARAVATRRGTRRMVGVSAQGMTASPYAQGVFVARARERLAAGGFSEARIARVLDRVPVATHDQIGVGTLHLGCPEDFAFEFDVPALLDIVEGAMSSEIFELMKRSDEAAVVERAHTRPRSVDDCVRAMIAGVVERFGDLPDAAFVCAAQESTETIRAHHVTAECAGLLEELRRELRSGEPVARRTSMREWLEAGGR